MVDKISVSDNGPARVCGRENVAPFSLAHAVGAHMDLQTRLIHTEQAFYGSPDFSLITLVKIRDDYGGISLQ